MPVARYMSSLKPLPLSHRDTVSVVILITCRGVPGRHRQVVLRIVLAGRASRDQSISPGGLMGREAGRYPERDEKALLAKYETYELD